MCAYMHVHVQVCLGLATQQSSLRLHTHRKAQRNNKDLSKEPSAGWDKMYLLKLIKSISSLNQQALVVSVALQTSRTADWSPLTRIAFKYTECVFLIWKRWNDNCTCKVSVKLKVHGLPLMTIARNRRLILCCQQFPWHIKYIYMTWTWESNVTKSTILQYRKH